MIYYKTQNGKIYYAKVCRSSYQGRPLVRHLFPYSDIKPFHSDWLSYRENADWLPIAPDDPINLFDNVISTIEEAEFDVDSGCNQNSDHDTSATVEGIRWKDQERVFMEIFTLINTWVKTYGEENVLIPRIVRELCSLESHVRV